MTQYFHDAHAHDADRNVSLLARNQYVREVHWITIMDRQEEVQLLERIKRGCYERKQSVPNEWRLCLAQHARDRVVESYQPLILQMAWSFARSSCSYDLPDFASEGTIGLLTFLDKLDRYSDIDGQTFHRLALSYIRGEMLAALGDRDVMMRVPASTYKMMKKVEALQRQWEDTHGCQPTSQDIAKALHLSHEKVLELLTFWKQRSVESVEGLAEEWDAEERLDFVSLFASEVQTNASRQTQMREAIEAAIESVLDKRSREVEVVRVRYGLGEGPCEVRSYTTVAAWLNMKFSTVHCCDERAKQKLRQALAMVVGHAVQSSCEPPHVA